MVEVFKTQVKNPYQASIILDHIHRAFIGYQANFDLEDCDKILRVACTHGTIQTGFLISFLESLGCKAERLMEDPEVFRDKH